MIAEAFLVPQPGLIVRDPVTKYPLPPEGGLKPLKGSEGVYWQRRLQDGSVTIKKEEKKTHTNFTVSKDYRGGKE